MGTFIEILSVALAIVGLLCISTAQYISRHKNHNPFFDFAFDPLFWVGAVIILLGLSVGNFSEETDIIFIKIISTFFTLIGVYCVVKIYLSKKYNVNKKAIKPLIATSIISCSIAIILILITIP